MLRGLRRARLVYNDDADWFDKEGMDLYTMDQYAGNTHGVKIGENIVPLRADLLTKRLTNPKSSMFLLRR